MNMGRGHDTSRSAGFVCGKGKGPSGRRANPTKPARTMLAMSMMADWSASVRATERSPAHQEKTKDIAAAIIVAVRNVIAPPERVSRRYPVPMSWTAA